MLILVRVPLSFPTRGELCSLAWSAFRLPWTLLRLVWLDAPRAAVLAVLSCLRYLIRGALSVARRLLDLASACFSALLSRIYCFWVRPAREYASSAVKREALRGFSWLSDVLVALVLHVVRRLGRDAPLPVSRPALNIYKLRNNRMQRRRASKWTQLENLVELSCISESRDSEVSDSTRFDVVRRGEPTVFTEDTRGEGESSFEGLTSEQLSWRAQTRGEDSLSNLSDDLMRLPDDNSTLVSELIDSKMQRAMQEAELEVLRRELRERDAAVAGLRVEVAALRGSGGRKPRLVDSLLGRLSGRGGRRETFS